MKLKLSKREEFMLWKLLEFPIHRYLLCISRGSGAERAERHLEMSEIILEVLEIKTYCTVDDFEKKMKVHDIIALNLTDYLDKTIDMNLERYADLDYDLLKDRFFRALLKIDYKLD